jgi:Putative transposase of IS4/5 family (DUF4096)
MWTEITRPKYERKGAGYSSNLSDAEWAMIEPRLPQRNRLGRPPKTETRNIVNALLYMVRTGCQWRRRCQVANRRLLMAENSNSGGYAADAVPATSRHVRKAVSRATRY